MSDSLRLRHLAGTALVVVAAPLLLSAAVKRSAVLRSVEPTVPLSFVRSSDVSPALTAPSEGTPAASSAIAAPTASSAIAAPAPEPVAGELAHPVRAPIRVEPLPSREVTVSLENINTEETADFQIDPAGYVRFDQASALEQFFRCRRTGRHKAIAPGVLSLLADVARRYPEHVIEIVSGFRAPPFGSPHSRHFTGHAIDLRVRGVRTASVRDYVWANHKGVGVGHYAGENFVHIDFRPGELDMAWSARTEDQTPQYNPRWASKARRHASGPL